MKLRTLLSLAVLFTLAISLFFFPFKLKKSHEDLIQNVDKTGQTTPIDHKNDVLSKKDDSPTPLSYHVPRKDNIRKKKGWKE